MVMEFCSGQRITFNASRGSFKWFVYREKHIFIYVIWPWSFDLCSKGQNNHMIANPSPLLFSPPFILPLSRPVGNRLFTQDSVGGGWHWFGVIQCLSHFNICLISALYVCSPDSRIRSALFLLLRGCFTQACPLTDPTYSRQITLSGSLTH